MIKPLSEGFRLFAEKEYNSGGMVPEITLNSETVNPRKMSALLKLEGLVFGEHKFPGNSVVLSFHD